MRNTFDVLDGVGCMTVPWKDFCFTARFDAVDLGLIQGSGLTWYANIKAGHVYVIGTDHKATQTYLHRLITNAPPKRDVDHINGDTLDNTRGNLRVAPRSVNVLNRSKPNSTKGRTSKHIGVTYVAGKWNARLGVGGKDIYLGRFKTEEEAASVVREARKQAILDAGF